jgi:hypothetical protein
MPLLAARRRTVDLVRTGGRKAVGELGFPVDEQRTGSDLLARAMPARQLGELGVTASGLVVSRRAISRSSLYVLMTALD